MKFSQFINQLVILLLAVVVLSCNTNIHESSGESRQIETAEFGKRLFVTGDFNGDGQPDTLHEHFISSINHKEIPDNRDIEYDSLVALTISQKPVSFITATGLDTLVITSKAQQLGLHLLVNEGDLNGDGADDISYVIEWADWSNVNTCYIASFTNNKWKELYSFPIREWQIYDSNFNGFILPGKTKNARIVYINDDAEVDTMEISLGK